MEVQIIQDFIPQGRKNRPANPMTARYITIHETANENPGANARAHAAYLKGDTADELPVSWHFTVDDTEIYQHLPLDENGWHAGDGGSGTGNRESIGVEICTNSDGNFLMAVKNAQWLVAKLISEQDIPVENIRQHSDWSGKNCPQIIRSTPDRWGQIIEEIKDEVAPEYIKLLKAKTDSPDDWVQFIEDNKSHPMGRWLPELIVKLGR